jgi:hypothetical protein
MRRPFAAAFSVALLFISAHRLPAPIVEELTPTPAPKATRTPKPTPKAVATPKPKPTPISFAGTWSGMVKESYFGQTSNLTLLVSADEKYVRMQSGGYDVGYPCYREGNTLHFVYNLPLGEGTTSMQLNPDGQSAWYYQHISSSGETVNSGGTLMRQR